MKAKFSVALKALSTWQASLPERSQKVLKRVDLAPTRLETKGQDLYIWVKATTERYVLSESRSFVLDGTGYPEGCYAPEQLGGGSKVFLEAPAEHRAAWHQRTHEINRYYDGVRRIMRIAGVVTRTIQGSVWQCAQLDKRTYIVLAPQEVRINDDISAGMVYPARNLTTSPEPEVAERAEPGIVKQDSAALRGWATPKSTGIHRTTESPAPVGYVPTKTRKVRLDI